MFVQTPKQLIDTGEIGNASTGDILYDGGLKINDNMNALYNAFSDQRKMIVDNGQGQAGQKIHATGYWQKATNPNEYVTPVELGSQHDIDTSLQGVQVYLPKGVRGEAVYFCNSNGSFSSTNPLVIDASDSFINVGQTIRITSPSVYVKCWCISDDNGLSVWNYSVESMFGEKQIPTDGTWSIGLTGNTEVPLFHMNEYNAAKYMITASTTLGEKQKSFEINILIDKIKKEVVSTEFAVIRIGATSEVEDIVVPTFYINPSSNMVIMLLTSEITGLRVAVKTIATQKLGVAR